MAIIEARREREKLHRCDRVRENRPQMFTNERTEVGTRGRYHSGSTNVLSTWSSSCHSQLFLQSNIILALASIVRRRPCFKLIARTDWVYHWLGCRSSFKRKGQRAKKEVEAAVRGGEESHTVLGAGGCASECFLSLHLGWLYFKGTRLLEEKGREGLVERR